MRWKTRWRAIAVCTVMALVFTGYSARLIHLQITRHEEFAALAAKKHSIRLTVPARRGMIVDRNGEVLAASIPVRKVIVDGLHVNRPGPLAQVAAPYLGLPAAALEDMIETARAEKNTYKVVLPELAEEKAVALMKAMDEKNLRGLYFRQNSTRMYPNGPMLSHVLGFLARKNPADEHVTGVEGIERSMGGVMEGEDGYRHIERDRTGREIVIYRGTEQPPRHGGNVRLTVDMNIQAILEAELDASYRDLQPENAIGIIVRPKTGEILALANRPAFDLSDLSAARPAGMKNRAILDMVEPGSTFKIVVASAALSERVVNDKTRIFCENGRFQYASRTLRDHHAYGYLNVHDILKVSSNIGSAKMALLLGDEKFYEYVRRFGFGERSGVALPGEIPGLVHPPSRWDRLTITRMPMGHSIAVTPLQMAMAMSVIANGGKLMRPRIVQAVTDAEGNEIQRFDPEVVADVIPSGVAAFVSNALLSVTGEGGTARLACVPGFTVAGKTGTAQKINPKGGYLSDKYVVSFIGYLPAENPEFVCLIMLDAPNVPSAYGGTIAAPVFSRVAEKTARYLNLTPAPKAEPVLPVAMGVSADRPIRR